VLDRVWSYWLMDVQREIVAVRMRVRRKLECIGAEVNVDSVYGGAG